MGRALPTRPTYAPTSARLPDCRISSQDGYSLSLPWTVMSHRPTMGGGSCLLNGSFEAAKTLTAKSRESAMRGLVVMANEGSENCALFRDRSELSDMQESQ